MFTGLVEDVGTITAVNPRGADAVELRLRTRLVEEGPLRPELAIGDSLAVDGCCLTITERAPASTPGAPGEVAVVAAFETLAKTTLGDRRPGHRVNLERALRLGDRLGGHLVSGHVDGVGEVRSTQRRGDALHVRFGLSRELCRHVIEKGSVTIDGVSLTVNAAGEDHFEVGLIPHTLEVTTLGELRPGRRVNVETDLLGKYVARLLGQGLAQAAPPAGGGVTRELLERTGFIGGKAGGEPGQG